MARPSDDHRAGATVPRPDTVPDSDAWLGRLIGVDGSGGASTAGNRDNTAKAILAGFTNGLGSGPPNLLEAYARWKRATKAAPSPADPEAVAMRKSRKRLARSLREGASPAAAVVAAHARYRKHGGRSSLPVWARKVAQG